MKNRRTNINERELTRTIRRILKEQVGTDASKVLTCIVDKLNIEVDPNSECGNLIKQAITESMKMPPNAFKLGQIILQLPFNCSKSIVDALGNLENAVKECKDNKMS